jgi:hypothetical protein
MRGEKMITIVCSNCGRLLEVEEGQVLEDGSVAILRKGVELSCIVCEKVFHTGDELVLEYELGDHSTPRWMKRHLHI